MALTNEDKTWFSSAMVGLLSPISARLEAIDTRLDRMDDRFDAIDTRLDRMDARFDAIDTRLDRVDARFDRIDDQLIATNGRIDALSVHLSNYILDMRTEIIGRLESVDQRLEFMANALLNVQPLTKGMVDLGALMSQLARGQQRSTDRHFDLETRVMRLEDKAPKARPTA